jgi:hypothetical protein
MKPKNANTAHNRDAPIASEESNKVTALKGMFCERFNICSEMTAKVNTGIHPIKKIHPPIMGMLTPSLKKPDKKSESNFTKEVAMTAQADKARRKGNVFLGCSFI